MANHLKHNVQVIGRKGLSLWISWVLIMAFVIMLSAFMLDWITGMSKSQTSDIEKRASESTDCSEVSLEIVAACQNSDSILIDVENVNLMEAKGLVIRLYDTYDNEETKEKNITIRPKKTERILLVKQGAISKVEIFPLLSFDNGQIYCRNSLSSIDNVRYC